MNNTAKHTPGPWVYDAEEGTVYDVPSDGDAMMLMVSDAGNGNLIAAAPVMYADLRIIRDYLYKLYDDGNMQAGEYAASLDTTLAQAEGRQG